MPLHKLHCYKLRIEFSILSSFLLSKIVMWTGDDLIGPVRGSPTQRELPKCQRTRSWEARPILTPMIHLSHHTQSLRYLGEDGLGLNNKGGNRPSDIWRRTCLFLFRGGVGRRLHTQSHHPCCTLQVLTIYYTCCELVLQLKDEVHVWIEHKFGEIMMMFYNYFIQNDSL